jgi:hypothetical protein
MLGKHMSRGWYKAPENTELQRFFDYLEDNPKGSQDDFILAMEDCTKSGCFEDWQYTDEYVDGFRKFIFT